MRTRTGATLTVIAALLAALTALSRPAEAQSSLADAENLGAHVLYDTDEDPFSDQQKEFLYVTSREEDAALIVRCTDDRDVYFAALNDYFGDGGLNVEWRFDEGSVHDGEWSASNDGTGAFVPDVKHGAILNGARHSDRLALRVYDYKGSPSTFIFPLDGFEEGARRLSCVVTK